MPPQPRPFQRFERRPARASARSHSDITPLTDLEHAHSRTGPVRHERPVHVDLLPPCNAGCPAGENIEDWMGHVKVGEHEQAWRLLTTDNPFPAIHGRVCYHRCESVCNRAELDSPTSIHAVERFPGDLALDELDCAQGLRVARRGARPTVGARGADEAAYERAGCVTAMRAANAGTYNPW